MHNQNVIRPTTNITRTSFEPFYALRERHSTNYKHNENVIRTTTFITRTTYKQLHTFPIYNETTRLVILASSSLPKMSGGFNYASVSGNGLLYIVEDKVVHLLTSSRL